MQGNRRLQFAVAGLVALLALIWIAIDTWTFGSHSRPQPPLYIQAVALALVLAASLGLGLYACREHLFSHSSPARAAARLSFYTALAFLAGLLVSSLLVHLDHGRKIAEKRAGALALATSQAQSLENVFDQARTTTTALAYLVQEHGDILPRFERQAAGLLRDSPAITNLQLAPDGVVRRIYPLEGHRQALGHDLLADPAQTPAAFEAFQTGRTTLEGPVNLLQGGTAVIIRRPVFMNRPEGQRFWGFATALITLDSLLTQAGLGYHGFNWSLQALDSDGNLRPFAASDPPPGPDPVIRRIKIPDGQWVLRLTPFNGWTQPGELLGDNLVILASTLFVTLLVLNGLHYPLQLRHELAERTQALDRERLLLRQTEAISHAGSWSYDRMRDELVWSEESYEILKLPRDVAPSREQVLAQVHPQDRASLEQAWRSLLFGHHYKLEYRLMQREGVLWLRETAVAERNGSPHVSKLVGACQDITERKEMELKLRTLCQAVTHSPAATVVTTAEPRVIYVNPRFTEMTGYTLAEVEGRTPNFWDGEHCPLPGRERVRETLTAGKRWEGELWHRKKDGRPILVRVAISPVRNNGEITHYVAVKEDITEKRQMERTIWHQANFDALTGLANRAHFADRCETAIDRAKRHQERVLLLFLDLNRFKPINDRYGHKAGDAVLKEFAGRLRNHIRSSDLAARMGGDEFTVLLEDLSNVEPVDTIIAKLRQALTERVYRFSCETDKTCEVFIGTSIGHALYPDQGQTLSQLLSVADQAMYLDKTRLKQG